MNTKNKQYIERELSRTAAIVDSSDDAIIGKDTKGIITNWNVGAERLYGYTASEVIGKAVSILIPPNKKNDFPQMMKKLLKGEKIEHYETQRKTKDGRILDVSITVSPILDSRGKVVGASKIARDITDRKRMENNILFLSEASKILSSSLDYKKTLTNVAHIAVPHIADWCTIDMLKADGSVELLVIAHKDPKRVKWAEAFRKEMPIDMSDQNGLPEVLRSGKSQYYPNITDEMIVQGAKNRKQLNVIRKMKLASLMIVPLCVEKSCIGAITFVSAESGRNYSKTDLVIAEELAARAALAIQNAQLYRDAQLGIETRDEFLNIASHELKTPITSLQLQLQMLKRRAKNATTINSMELIKILDAKELQLKRLTKLINNLLDVSRINSQRINLELEDMDLSDIIYEVIDRFDDALKDSQVNLDTHIESHIIGHWDRFKIDQVLTNLISNALKYGSGNPITISVEQKDASAEIIIQDQGIGIESTEIQKIFDRFERTAIARQYDGLGLGLYIANQFIEAHGGKITVRSKPGKGSSFTIHLPVSQ